MKWKIQTSYDSATGTWTMWAMCLDAKIRKDVKKGHVVEANGATHETCAVALQANIQTFLQKI